MLSSHLQENNLSSTHTYFLQKKLHIFSHNTPGQTAGLKPDSLSITEIKDFYQSLTLTTYTSRFHDHLKIYIRQWTIPDKTKSTKITTSKNLHDKNASITYSEMLTCFFFSCFNLSCVFSLACWNDRMQFHLHVTAAFLHLTGDFFFNILLLFCLLAMKLVKSFNNMQYNTPCYVKQSEHSYYAAVLLLFSCLTNQCIKISEDGIKIWIRLCIS